MSSCLNWRNIIILTWLILTSASPALSQYQNNSYALDSSNNSQPPFSGPQTPDAFNGSPGNFNAPGNVIPFTQPYAPQAYPSQSNQPYPVQPPSGQFLPNQNAPNTAVNLCPTLHHQVNDLTNQAYLLSKSGKNEQAIALLQQALAIDPNSSAAHLNMSVALIALKRYDEALKESSIVLQLDPNEENAYLDYLAAAIGANRMPDALRVGQAYLDRFPKGQKRTTLTNEMIAVSQEMDRRAKTQGIMPPPGAPDNYLFYVTPSGKRRWPPYALPLKVFIYQGQNCKGFDHAFETALITSFINWQNASRGLVRFIPVNDPSQANIECRWTDSAADLALAAEAGDAEVKSINGNISHVIITLLTCRPEKTSEPISLNLMRQVSLHEIGHALGLNGHSDNAQDIMYCATDPNVEYVGLTRRDLNTLFLLYQF